MEEVPDYEYYGFRVQRRVQSLRKNATETPVFVIAYIFRFSQKALIGIENVNQITDPQNILKTSIDFEPSPRIFVVYKNKICTIRATVNSRNNT